MVDYFIRLGSMGQIHAARSSRHYQRGDRVIVRTARGVELAEIVRKLPPKPTVAATDGAIPSVVSRERSSAPLAIIRRTTREDEMMIQRLDKHKRAAVESCRAALSQSGSDAVLLDVDQIFDGGTLVMHFLGTVGADDQRIVDAIAKQYESIVQSESFAKRLNEGCGPGCGDQDSAKPCTGACHDCAAASACRP